MHRDVNGIQAEGATIIHITPTQRQRLNMLLDSDPTRTHWTDVPGNDGRGRNPTFCKLRSLGLIEYEPMYERGNSWKAVLTVKGVHYLHGEEEIASVPELKISTKMVDTLRQLKGTKSGQTTSFGYVPGQGTQNRVNLNASTVKALIARGLLEESGSMPWNTVTDMDGRTLGHMTLLYRISDKGEEVLRPKIFANWTDAQAAMDRGETVRVEQEPFVMDSRLLQLAQDLQDKEVLEEWKQCQ